VVERGYCADVSSCSNDAVKLAIAELFHQVVKQVDITAANYPQNDAASPFFDSIVPTGSIPGLCNVYERAFPAFRSLDNTASSMTAISRALVFVSFAPESGCSCDYRILPEPWHFASTSDRRQLTKSPWGFRHNKTFPHTPIGV
jgi:hypothetical protein